VVDPKQQFDDLNAKLKDFQLQQAQNPDYTYKKKIEDLQAPEQVDYVSEYKQLLADQGVDTANDQLTAIDSKIADYKAEVEKQTYSEEGRVARMSIINAKKNKIAENANIEIQRLYDQKAVIQNSISLKTDSIKTIMGLMETGYSQAKEAYDTSFKKYTTLQEMTDTQEDRAWDRQSEEKKTAATNLKVVQDMVGAYIKNGKSFEEIPENIKQQIRTLELGSGIPEGSTEQILGELTPEEDIVDTKYSDDGTQVSVITKLPGGKIGVKTYSTGLPAKVTSGESNETITGGATGSVERDAQSIMAGDLKASQLSTAKNYAAQVMARVSELRKEAEASGDIYGMMGASAGGKEVTDSVIISTEKAANVVGQIADLQSIFNSEKEQKNFASEIKKATGVDVNPQFVLLRKFNPYDQDAQSIKAALQAIVPNLARGIYGEVGVLTDNDIKNYSKTLPTLTSTEEVRKAVLGITIRSIQRSVENKIKSNVAAGRDMSGYKQMYGEITQAADNLLGVETKQAGQTIKQNDGSEWKQNADGSFTQIK
jgi:hypothetical protein